LKALFTKAKQKQPTEWEKSRRKKWQEERRKEHGNERRTVKKQAQRNKQRG
jgi:hypothetical protein